MSHQLLSDIAKQRRDKESKALHQLTTYRATLDKMIQQSSTQLSVLQKQRDIKVSRGAQAAELILLEQSLCEHQQHIHEVTCELAALDMAIKQQKKKWVEAHKTLKSHEKLHQQLQRKAKHLLNQKQQMIQDDQFSASLLHKKRVSI
jgi:flagellar biosynthesis chaperone FliJ